MNRGGKSEAKFRNSFKKEDNILIHTDGIINGCPDYLSISFKDTFFAEIKHRENAKELKSYMFNADQIKFYKKLDRILSKRRCKHCRNMLKVYLFSKNGLKVYNQKQVMKVLEGK